LLLLSIPATASESELTTAWDAGYTKAPVLLPETIEITPIYKTIGNGSCVAFVKWRLGITDSWYTPKYLWEHHEDLGFIESEIRVGSVVVLKEGYVWHVAVITNVSIEEFSIEEQNYKGTFVSTRTLPNNYTKIVGLLERSGQ
jgi:hypothetical protein